MAARFSSAEDICEGENCEAFTDVTYYVKEKKKLCEDCASKGGCIGKARKGRPNLYCEKHDEEIKLYCKTHGVAVCHSCAMIDHLEQSCVRQDIEGAIVESRATLNILKEKANDKLKLCRVYGNRIHQCGKDTDNHIQALKDEVDLVINEAFQTDKDAEKEDAAKINQETDEKNHKLQEEIQKINKKIQKNNKEREKQLERNRTNAEMRREPIDNKQHCLQMDIKNIAEEKERKIGELENALQDDTKTTENTLQTLDTVLKDDKNVVKDGHHVKTSVSDELKKPLNEAEVEQITGAISGVRFVKGAGREKYNGRIDWYDGEWKLIDTINVKDKIRCPAVVGCIDECYVIITDILTGSRHTHMLDMNTENTQRVITDSDTSWATSCALLNDDKVVCGKGCEECSGDSLTGCIGVYDRQWKRINDVTIPRNTPRDDTWVDLAVDQDGIIIVAEGGQSKIYVINPADGKIMNTITGFVDIKMRGVLSSGHIITQPCPVDHRVFIIDRQGAQREIPHIPFKVRLIGGPDDSEGRVEIFYDGSWQTVCDNNWDFKEAKVVCRMLGFDGALAAPRAAAYGQGSGGILLDSLGCDGTEDNIADCYHRGVGVHNCEHANDAGVRCFSGTDPFQVRLIGSVDDAEGRVEVLYDGSWGTICDSDWDIRDATVVCRMLDFDGAMEATHSARFGKGSGDSILEGVRCRGREDHLAECLHAGFGSNVCAHEKDAGAICYSNVRLVGGSDDAEGRVEIQHMGVWGTICHDQWDILDATVVCRMLGFQGAALKALGSSYFGKGIGAIFIKYYFLFPHI
eukprot:XP_011671452.1 PREDICTED: scavenger receptor cysteine-rich domain superfamily protein-like [Strongylocentrotus purpuratus]